VISLGLFAGCVLALGVTVVLGAALAGSVAFDVVQWVAYDA